MTIKTLEKANYLITRLKEVDKLLKAIEEEKHPLGLQAGLQSPVEFYFNSDDSNPLADVDASYYKQFIQFLHAYKDYTEKQFNALED